MLSIISYVWQRKELGMEDKKNNSPLTPPEVDYKCTCGATFKAIQGSRKYLCPDCLFKALSAPKVRTKGGE
jgi:DNA-directed RNA polymerase subunit RPC12/RpoP